MEILAGDIGGTNTRLAAVRYEGREIRTLVRRTYASASFARLEDPVAEFLAETGFRPVASCFGVAGPVVKGVCQTPNLPWTVEEPSLAKVAGTDRTQLINDLVANAYGISTLAPEDQFVIHPGSPDAEGNGAVISAGTGLGEAGLFWDGRRHHPFASEGGHADFAARTSLEMELSRYLEKRFHRVSYERVLSGPGLYSIYQFLRDHLEEKEPEWLTRELAENDPPETISRAAMEGKNAICKKALDFFIQVYGAEAGNLALKLMATGGVWLGGGIIKHLSEYVRDTPTFMRSFTSKGRLGHLVERIPVRIIVNDLTALWGAAVHCIWTYDPPYDGTHTFRIVDAAADEERTSA